VAHRGAFLLAVTLLACACRSGSERAVASPVAAEGIPVDLRIPVEIDGREVAPIDSVRLAQTPADFVSEDRRAWKLTSLLGAPSERESALIAVTGDKGVSVVFSRPRTQQDPIAVLWVTRRGETIASMTAPGEPFPPYHGHGGQMHRPPDPLPRIAGVTKVRVYLDGKPSTRDAAHFTPVEVIVTGRPPTTWSEESFDKAPREKSEAVGSDREAWSLRDLARTLVGPGARVVMVVGDVEKRIDATEWADTSRTPILRVAGGGKLKFRWIEKDGQMGEADVKAVRRLVIEP
jgi:hypothetical protein